MKKNDVLTMEVEAFGAQAEGLCRHEGQVVFVQGALPSELITAKILKTHPSYAYGRLVEILRASPERVEPPCPYYPRCGGCACQHMSYEAELRFKRGYVQDLLERVAGIALEVPPVLGMESPWRYRNKTAMPVMMVDGRAEAGFFMRRSHRLVPVERCLIASEASEQAVGLVMRWLRETGVSAYDEQRHSGILRHIVVREANSGDLMLLLVINAQALPAQEELIALLTAELSRLKSLCVSVNTEPGNTILGTAYQCIWGEERLIDRLCGFSFALSPLSFFQVNSRQAERLYLKALELAAPRPEDRVIDLYCGAGTISSLFAAHCREVLGIELVSQAVADARLNAQRNGIGNLRFEEGAAERLLPQLVAAGERPDIVVMDPPRKGLEPPVLKALADTGARRLVYISCHPGTQARDAKELTALGYRATACQPVDMFCRTAEVENVLLFERSLP